MTGTRATLGDMERDDPTFVDDLFASMETVWLVARTLQARGLPVVVQPLFVRPKIEDLNQYTDHGDLAIVQRVEVKRRIRAKDAAFTSASDYPFPSIMVDTAHTWDNAKPKPYAYVIVNGAGTAAAIIHGSTCRSWRKVTRYDKYRHRERTFYVCPTTLARFIALGQAS